jgi:putative PIN family toxin of toxin-antitoxin system
MRIVLDTNILARATPGPDSLSRELVRRLSAAPHVMILSPFILSELSRALGYPRLRRVHGLDDAGIRQHVDDLQTVALVVNPPAGVHVGIVAHDPEDNPIVVTAIEGQAEVICTLDHHVRHADVRTFCSKHGIRILSDVELIQELRAADVQTP